MEARDLPPLSHTVVAHLRDLPVSRLMDYSDECKCGLVVFIKRIAS